MKANVRHQTSQIIKHYPTSPNIKHRSFWVLLNTSELLAHHSCVRNWCKSRPPLPVAAALLGCSGSSLYSGSSQCIGCSASPGLAEVLKCVSIQMAGAPGKRIAFASGSICNGSHVVWGKNIETLSTIVRFEMKCNGPGFSDLIIKFCTARYLHSVTPKLFNCRAETHSSAVAFAPPYSLETWEHRM